MSAIDRWDTEGVRHLAAYMLANGARYEKLYGGARFPEILTVLRAHVTRWGVQMRSLSHPPDAETERRAWNRWMAEAEVQIRVMARKPAMPTEQSGLQL